MLIAAESAGRREMLLDILQRRNVQPQLVDSWSAFVEGSAPLGITVSPISTGLVLTEPPLALIAEEQLFGERARQERRRRRAERDPEKIIRDLTDLRPGSPVVHEEYGVGRFVGLATLDVGGLTNEFLLLEYADGDKLYVPVHALDLVSRYTGAPAETAPLHKLGRRCLGEGEAARPRSAFTTPPPSCSICTRAAPRARASNWSRTKPSCARSRLRSRSRKRRIRRRRSSR